MNIAELQPDEVTERILRHILAEFAPDDPALPWTDNEIRVAVPMGKFSVPELVRATLVWAGFVSQRWDDKTAWRLGGRFRDRNISFSSTKFGLRIMVETDCEVTHRMPGVSAVGDVDGPDMATDNVARKVAAEGATMLAKDGKPDAPAESLDDLGSLVDKAIPGFWGMVKVPRSVSSTRHDLSDDPELEALVDDFLAALGKAVRVFDKRVFSSLVKDQVAAGNVTLLNQHHRLRGAYEFFRRQAQSFIDGSGDEDRRLELTSMLGFPADSRSSGDRFINELLTPTEVGYCLTAMASAYFSWLEHVLVLALPFTEWDPAQRSITDVIGDSWSDKWRRVVPTSNSATTAFDRLKVAAEEFRNLDAHGGFGKKERSLLIHTPFGVMPARLMEGADAIRASIIPEVPAGFPQACAVFDATDEFLHTGPLAAAMTWIGGGLQVPFHAEHREALKEAMNESDQAFEDEVTRFAEFEDRITNFELY